MDNRFPTSRSRGKAYPDGLWASWQTATFQYFLVPMDYFLSRGVRRCAQQWQPELVEAAKAWPWEDRETLGPKPGKKKQERTRAAMLEEVMKEYHGDAEAQAIALFARQRAADAINSSQGQATDGVDDKSSVASEHPSGLPGPKGEDEQPVPTTEAGTVEEKYAAMDVELQQGGGAAMSSNKRSEDAREEAEEEVPHKAQKLVEVEEPPEKVHRRHTAVLPVGATSSSSSTLSTSRTLSSSPTFAGNLNKVTKVILGENDEVEVDEEMLEEPGRCGEVEEIDLTEWDKHEDDGPPTLSAEELEKVDAEAEEREERRLIEMHVLIKEDEEHRIDESFRRLTTRQVKDWRFRENKWQRRSRLVARDYKLLTPELEGLFSPASNGLSTKLWAAVVQSSKGQLCLFSADVKDAYLMVEQEEKVYVVTRTGERYILGRNLPGQRTGSKNWYDLLSEVLQKKGLKPYSANPSVFFKAKEDESSLPLVVSTHVDDLQIMGSEKKVEELLQHLRDQGWQLQVEGPCGPHLAGQCSFLKRKFVSDGQGNLWVKLSDKYITKMVEELNLEQNKGKAVPTTGQFQKGLQYKPMPVDKARVFRTCVGILLYMAGERADIQCATRALASKVTCPDEGDWKELKQVVLYLKNTTEYAQKMTATGSMSSAVYNMMYPNKPEEEEASACSGPSLLQVFSDADWAGDRQTRKSVSCAMYYISMG